MAQTINTNIASLTAQRNLAASQKDAATAMQRLSSGLRINSAKDDAAGLAIGNRLTSQINGINQAIRNANDGLSVTQVAEGALAESSSILQRMRELAVQSANASNSTSDRAALQTEVAQLSAEITRIASNTSFGSTKILDGTFTSKNFQVGANVNETMGVSITSAKADALGNVKSLTFDTFNSANASALSTLANASSGVTGQTLSMVVGGTTSTVSVAADATAATIASSINANVAGVNASASTAVKITMAGVDGSASEEMTIKINDHSFVLNLQTAANANGLSAALASAVQNHASFAGFEVTDGTGGVVTVRDNTGADIKVEFDATTNGANANTVAVQAVDADGTVAGSSRTLLVASTNTSVITGDITFTVTDATIDYDVFSTDGSGGLTSATASGTSVDTLSTSTTTVNDINISTVAGANTAIQVIDTALTQIDSQRATLGAVQSRFDSVVSNLSNVAENSSAARSRIMDADFASETAQLAKTQILQQAGISVLAQANAQPQNVLALLQ